VSASGMPSNYQIFIKGLWHLDRKQFPVHIFPCPVFSHKPR
jgi:hypothetical protein